MTRAELDAHLFDVPSWATAPSIMKAEFQRHFITKRYGKEETGDAWHWFYEGWCGAGIAMVNSVKTILQG